MTDRVEDPGAGGLLPHYRWSRTSESGDFFVDEDRLRMGFYVLMASGTALLAVLAAGLWRLQRAALAPPAFVGIAHGLVFSGRPEGIASVREDDFDRQLADTVEVLLGRTEKGLPPAIAQFCAPDVVGAVDQAYREASGKYPAGFVQTLALLESKAIVVRPGFRRMYYRGLLSSRSVSAGQTSPIYLDCTFVIGAPTPLNAVGWRLVRMDALGRDDYYRAEHEKAERQRLNLPPAP
jgi:hypothetical protein